MASVIATKFLLTIGSIMAGVLATYVGKKLILYIRDQVPENDKKYIVLPEEESEEERKSESESSDSESSDSEQLERKRRRRRRKRRHHK